MSKKTNTDAMSDTPMEKPPMFTVQTGKGGSGKSTAIAILYSLYVQRGIKPLLIKTDPNPTCAALTGTDSENVAPISNNSAMLEILQQAITAAKLEGRPILMDVPADGEIVNGKAVNSAAALLSCGVSMLTDLTVVIPVIAEKSSIEKALEILTYFESDLHAKLVLGFRSSEVGEKAIDSILKSISRWGGGKALIAAVPDAVIIPDLGTITADWQSLGVPIPEMGGSLRELALKSQMRRIEMSLGNLIAPRKEDSNPANN